MFRSRIGSGLIGPLASNRVTNPHTGFAGCASIMEIPEPGSTMPFPIKICAVCEEEFELKPDKPGFANRCPQCSEPDAEPAAKGRARRR